MEHVMCPEINGLHSSRDETWIVEVPVFGVVGTLRARGDSQLVLNPTLAPDQLQQLKTAVDRGWVRGVLWNRAGAIAQTFEITNISDHPDGQLVLWTYSVVCHRIVTAA
jgi:hypothetical protein